MLILPFWIQSEMCINNNNSHRLGCYLLHGFKSSMRPTEWRLWSKRLLCPLRCAPVHPSAPMLRHVHPWTGDTSLTPEPYGEHSSNFSSSSHHHHFIGLWCILRVINFFILKVVVRISAKGSFWHVRVFVQWTYAIDRGLAKVITETNSFSHSRNPQ